MKAKLLTLLVALTAICSVAQAENINLNIIPEPVQSVITGDSCYRLGRGAVIRTEANLRFPAEYLAEYTDHYLGMPLKVEVPQPVKRRGKTIAVTEPLALGVRLVNLNNGKVSGGYRLKITHDNGVVIEGNDAAGVFYGVQTLIQLLPTQAGVLPRLPEVEIEDYPRFEYRGMHLDVVRHFFPIDYVKRYIDYMALHKLNYFHWHLTDDQG
ncbi:MAG: family 20 glycosylhydrolase, partial [Rikenellaceae bacterium]|nr:family 20 glycosylhydrolase [Rikenellaceae bacterium]